MDRVAARILGFLIWITNKGELNQIGCINFPEFRIFGVMVELRHPGPRGRWFEPGRWFYVPLKRASLLKLAAVEAIY